MQKRAKFGTAASVTNALPTLTFMGNCLVELYSGLPFLLSARLCLYSPVGPALAYGHAEEDQGKLSDRLLLAVYSLSSFGWLSWLPLDNEDSTMLRSLIYPLTEVILGTVRLLRSRRGTCLCVCTVRLLQQLAAAMKCLSDNIFAVGLFGVERMAPEAQENKGVLEPCTYL
jgi:hypothetical protein